MAVNLSKKSCSKVIQEAAIKNSVLHGVLREDVDFTGVQTVSVHTLVTQEMNEYSRTGTNRYGTPKEVEDLVQELKLTQDRAFCSTIDKGNAKDSAYQRTAAKFLEAQMAERAIPEFDQYCLGQLATNAGTTNEDKTALTKSNVATRIMTGTEVLDDAEFPEAGRTLLVSAKVYKLIKLSDEFTSIQALGVKSIGKGHVGEFDGMPVRKVSRKRMPAGVNFLIVHKSAGTAPKKLHDTKIHQDPPGISGNLLEGRLYYDCFVLERRAEGVYADKEA